MKEGRLPKPDSKMSLSRLESLPVELLQSIFLCSLNVHLPLASPYLALALSNEHVYTRLILLAFSGTQRDGEALLYPDLTSASLQTAIMSRRWFRLDLMRRCQVLFATDILERERSNSAWEIISDETEKISLQDNRDGLISKRSYRLQRDHLSKRVAISQMTTNTLVNVVEKRSTAIYDFPLCISHAWVERSEHVLLPEKLLHGPWNDEKLDLLEMLCMAGATVDWVNTSAGEIAEQGLNDAIMEENRRAVNLLIRGPTSDLSWKPRYIYWEIERKNVRVRINTRHVRLAVLEAGCNLDIVEELLQHPDSTVDLNDRQIVSWAVKHNAEGDIRGKQLLNRLDNWNARE